MIAVHVHVQMGQMFGQRKWMKFGVHFSQSVSIEGDNYFAIKLDLL